MIDVKYSFVAAAIRSENYRRLYDSINDTNIPFEIVLVGHEPPKEIMPVNFRYIYTEIRNTVQCLEISSRAAVGEYLLNTGDDYIYSDGFLDRIDYYERKLYMDKVLIQGRYQMSGTFIDGDLTFDVHFPKSPVVGSPSVFKREIWKELGGLDRRFKGAMCDVDMTMRFYEAGYSPFITPDCWGNELKGDIAGDLWERTGIDGKIFCNSLWMKNGEVVTERQSSVVSFEDKDILIHDQFEDV